MRKLLRGEFQILKAELVVYRQSTSQIIRAMIFFSQKTPRASDNIFPRFAFESATLRGCSVSLFITARAR